MEQDILSRIEQKSKKFSKGQRQIAGFIQENYDKAAFMNAVKLAHTVGVSESTVVRFASQLGYDGYPEMRRALQEMIRNRLTSVQRIEVARDTMDSQDILTSVLTGDAEKIRMTLDGVDKQAFETAVNTLLGAKRIFILGLRAAAVLSSFMGFYLGLTRENVRVVNDTYVNEVFEQILNIGPGDVLFAISFPRYSRRTVRAMSYARDRGATTIGLTDAAASPIAGMADIKLLAKSDMVSYLDSLVAPLSVINALLVAMGWRSEAEISETFQRLERIWAEYDVFETSTGQAKHPAEGEQQ
ncbi:MAG: MurR/RpiR family transcriptional regulator [Oscillospiraceae bacterium]|nr:MurR/RpiR family transcriptional regulator [Oscillospiraceae bacterium]